MVMDPNTIRALAEIRQRLSQLESALGANTPEQAEQIVRKLAAAVRQLRQDMDAGQDQIVQLRQDVNDGQDQLAQLAAQLSTAQDQIVQLRTRGNQLSNTVQAQQTTIAAQADQITSLTTQVQALAAQVAALTPPPPVTPGGP